MKITDRLSELGLSLPDASAPGGAYTSVNVRGNIAYIAIQFPIRNGDYLYQGRLGDMITTELGYHAAQLCALNVLAQIDKHVGFDRLVGINHFDGYFQAETGWDNSPEVMNGASDLFVQVLADQGQHARAIFGVERLPRDFCVGLTTSCTVKSL